MTCLYFGLFITAAALGASPLAPVANPAEVVWEHAPYGVGQCSICHASDNAKNPGKVNGDVNKLCIGCHEEMGENLETLPTVHFAAEEACTNCHNPHNSRFGKLLIDEAPKLCFECHDDVEKVITTAVVKHGAVQSERSCLNCHNPHASNVEALLNQLPFDMCITCHGVDGVKDDDGKTLTNFKTLLADNPVRHGPVEAKDCGACHDPHGSTNIRLLKQAYPKKFYSPYQPENYALCFKCHNEQLLATEKTTTLTKFRDGDTNLHFKHVNRDRRGRTCRACHEVHASKQPHMIRDGVPYGPSGWVLPINYTPAKQGGQCTKTCHQTRSYKNRK